MPYLPLDDSPPVISTGAIKAVLEGMLFAYRRPRPSPLSELYVVDQVVKNLAFPPASQARQYALHVVLTDLIRTRFEHLLAIFQLSPLEDHHAYTDAIRHLQRCSQVGKPELLGWCWLYYHYGRSDLEISREVFCATCHIDPRSLYRYQTAVLRRLTRSLVEAEWQARSAARQRWFVTGRL